MKNFKNYAFSESFKESMLLFVFVAFANSCLVSCEDPTINNLPQAAQPDSVCIYSVNSEKGVQEVFQSKIIYQYDENGNKISEITVLRNSEEYGKIEYEYDARNNRIAETQFTRNIEENKWVEFLHKDYTYNSKDKLVRIVVCDVMDKDGSRDSIVVSNVEWLDDLQSWTYQKSLIYGLWLETWRFNEFYSETGKSLKRVAYYYNPDSKSWDEEYTIECTYDHHDNVVLERRNEHSIISEYTCQNTYNEDGLLLTVLSTQGNSQEKKVYYYTDK